MQETLLPIQAVARKLEIPEKYLEQLGSKSGKVKLELLSDPTFKRRGKLIIVTATTPTAAGEGKTVTSISLTQGLAQRPMRSLVRLHFPLCKSICELLVRAGARGFTAGKGNEHNLISTLRTWRAIP